MAVPKVDFLGDSFKVADMSICPANVATVCVRLPVCSRAGVAEFTCIRNTQNTYSTAVTIGEKAAVIIAEELGITL